jgi:glycosyltransferase involved in cell wall biosynthesis
MSSTIKQTQSDTSKKKIAFVYDAIYPYIKGGAERRYFELAKRLSKKGYEPHLYGMKLWKGCNVIQREGVYLHGICPSKPLYTKDGRRSIWQAIFFGIHCLKLIKEDFDIIDCCGFPYFSLFVCKSVCLLKRKRLYSTWHEVWGNKYWEEYLGNLAIFGIWVEKFCSRIPDEIIAVSEQTAIRIKKELGYKGKIYIIPNGIDVEYINKTKPSLIKSDVIYAGRLMDFKNIDLLIESVFILKKNKNYIKCIIIGDGPEKDNLANLTKKLRLQNDIKFIRFLGNHGDVYSYMKASKVFVLPSTREGFGIVVLEANTCGIPVITVNHKDNAAKDLVEEGKNGYTCGLDEKEIAKRIMAVFEKGMNNNTKQFCTDSARKYDWNKIASGVEEVYLK